jgi:hypothetical protein
LAAIGTRLSVDDAYSWLVASSPNGHVFLERLADNENTPPPFYLVLMLVPNFGPAWLRVPAAVPGVLMCLAVWFALRPRIGDRPALLAALAVAVDPYLVTYSNLARGFMLADLALIGAIWSMLSLADRETGVKWLAYVVCGGIAVWTEYASAICVVALVAAAFWVGGIRRRSAAAYGLLPLLTLAAWIPEIIRGENQVGVTKFNPFAATPSLTGLRDVFLTLTFGENGGTANPAARWLIFILILGVAAGGYVIVRRRWNNRSIVYREAGTLIAPTALLTLVGYALASVVGLDVFTERYLTILVPLGAVLGVMAITSVSNHWLVPAASIALLMLGVGNFARQRLGRSSIDRTTSVPAAEARAHDPA